VAASLEQDSALFTELWISLASVLRSYAAAHGLSRPSQAVIEAGDKVISVHHGSKWLRFERDHAFVTWTRDNGSSGNFQLTSHGRVRSSNGEEELDLAAESWARDLMLNQPMEPAR
jgi:hypothetical protein